MVDHLNFVSGLEPINMCLFCGKSKMPLKDEETIVCHFVTKSHKKATRKAAPILHLGTFSTRLTMKECPALIRKMVYKYLHFTQHAYTMIMWIKFK